MSAAFNPTLSVVIPTHNRLELVLACLASLTSCGDPALEIVVVDDGGEDGLAQALAARFPRVRLLRRDQPGGFSLAANTGLAAARGELLLLLNNDTEVDATALAALRQAFADQPTLGIAGAALRYPDGRPQWSGGEEPGLLWLFGLTSGLPALLGRSRLFRRWISPSGSQGGDVAWVTGAALAMRREVLASLTELDTRFHAYAQDLDFCLRARSQGWRVAVIAELTVMHHHGATLGEQGDAVDRHRPDLLWADLLRWAAKAHGETWAQRARLVMRCGARLRQLGRWLGSPWPFGVDRATWRRQSAAYRAAGRALADFRPEPTQTSR